MDLWFELFAGVIVGALLDSKTIKTADGGWLFKGEEPYADAIRQAENQYGIPPRLLASLLYQESRYRADIINGSVRSSAGALGIAQFMPATAVEQLGSVEAALDPMKAIPGAAKYLRWNFNFLRPYGGGWRDAVIAYNWGPGNAKRWIQAGRPVSQLPGETKHYASVVYDEVFA